MTPYETDRRTNGRTDGGTGKTLIAAYYDGRTKVTDSSSVKCENIDRFVVLLLRVFNIKRGGERKWASA